MRLFDYPRWAEPLREELRTHAERLAAEACLEIEFIRHYKAFRKEERVKAILAARGEHPGLVHIFSAMEACPSYRPWHDKLQQSFNLFLGEDHSLFITLARGEWNISGFRASDLRAHLRDLSTGRASYWLKRLRTHGLIKKIGHRYKYYLTTFGRRVLTTALAIREYVVMPSLSTATA